MYCKRRGYFFDQEDFYSFKKINWKYQQQQQQQKVKHEKHDSGNCSYIFILEHFYFVKTGWHSVPDKSEFLDQKLKKDGSLTWHTELLRKTILRRPTSTNLLKLFCDP